MNITELQILFQQKIQDTNPVFEIDQRPDTFSIANYLNKAIDKYLERKYLVLPTFQQRLVAIDNNIDELRNLITPHGSLTASKNLAQYNWTGRGQRYRTPDDVLIPISLVATVTRTEVYSMSGQSLFVDWISRRQAEKIISDTANKTMYPRPLAIWEDPYYIMLIGDAYTTSITAGAFTYLRKPYKLDFNYTELTAVGTGNLDITAIANSSYFLTKANITYVNSGGTPTQYRAGQKVQKITGHNTITYLDEPIVVGYPWGQTDTPDFPAYLHDMIVDIAVSLFLDEAKFKLIPKTA